MELQRDRHCEQHYPDGQPLSLLHWPQAQIVASFSVLSCTYLCYVLFLAKNVNFPLAMYWYVPSWQSAPQAMTFTGLIWSPDNRSITTQEHWKSKGKSKEIVPANQLVNLLQLESNATDSCSTAFPTRPSVQATNPRAAFIMLARFPSINNTGEHL